MKKILLFIKERVPVFFTVSLSIMLVSLAVIRVAIVNTAFADLINRTLAHGYRRILALVTDLLPFSLFEMIIAFIPLWIALIVIFAVRASKRKKKTRFILVLVGAVFLFYSFYLWGLSMPYHTTTVDDKMELSADEVSPDEIYETLLTVRDEVNFYAAAVGDVESGSTVMPYSFGELAEKINLAYVSFDERYEGVLTNYRSRPKRIVHGGVMSDLHLVGVYSFFTGEANVSTDYPDYNTPFTMAHEMAHQRGILRENEANFVAFLVCLESRDTYVRYSAYLNMLEYLASALNKTDPDRYREIYGTLDSRAIADMKASSEVFNKHKDSLYGKLMEKFNDGYIKNNGSEGTVSYGLVVRLAVAYYDSDDK